MSFKLLQTEALASAYRSVLDVFTPLTIPNYRRMFSSNSIWWMSIFMEMVAMGWLVLELTDSAWLVSFDLDSYHRIDVAVC